MTGALRSAMHSGSLAFYHLYDKNRVRSLPEFTGNLEDKSSKEKKVMIVTVDESPYENPRYTNTISSVQLIILMSSILMYILLR